MSRNLLLLLFALPAFASDRYKFDEHQPITHTFSASTKLLVDNVNGTIHVIGGSGPEIRVKADMHFRAETPEAMAEAKRDVKIDMNQQGSFARVYLDGPFRGNNHRGDRYYGYQVSVDFEVEVPFATELIMKSVNGGIDLDKIAGAADVQTVNGGLTAKFNRNPTSACTFRTVNGKVDVYFQPSLNADFRFKTLNGEVYSDFTLTPLPSQATTAEQQNGRFIYKSNRLTGGRAGQGGPELTFDTVNGGIRLHTR